MRDSGIVLIVEDDPDLANFLRAALQRRMDRSVRVASNAREALHILGTETVDVLMTDIQMPGMSGLDLVGEVRKTLPALPIIVMTAHATVDYAVGALRHQVDDFLIKPITAAALVPKVRELAERGTAARQTARAMADVRTDVLDAAEVTRLERQMLLDLATVMGEQTSLSQQLQRAAQVQRDLLPRNAPSLPGYEFAGACLPSYAIGGDFYDWYPAADSVDFTVADVMGKGIPAAIVTATVRAVMRGVVRTEGPATALQAADVALLYDLEETGTFVTVFHGRLDGPTGQVTYADAGHGLTLHVRADGSWTRLDGSDLPLGVLRDGSWTERVVALLPGDTLISFSDGLFDMLGGTNEVFEHVAMMVLTTGSCAALVDGISAMAAREEALMDDVTLIVIKRLSTTRESG